MVTAVIVVHGPGVVPFNYRMTDEIQPCPGYLVDGDSDLA
jgi:hypothetical protein